MIPNTVYDFNDFDAANVDPQIAYTLRLVEQQFKQLLLASTRISLGQIANATKCQNLNLFWMVHTFGGSANTDETINHPLGSIPRGIINVDTPLFDGTAPVVGTVTFGSVPPTTTQVTVRCTAAAKVATFILVP